VLASLLWPEHSPRPPHLTRRERDLLPLLEAGLRFKQIARELSISEPTVKGYARDMFRKLGVSSRAEAVFEARRQGLI
jgi:DNA-binding NarL/FixJ family response regulator